MHWIAPAERDTDNPALEKRLRAAADQFRANSGFKSEEYSAPVLGLTSLGFAEVRFTAQRTKLEKAHTSSRRSSFPAIVALSFRLIYKLHLQIQDFRLTRDLLLPRLLSGQVKFEEN